MPCANISKREGCTVADEYKDLIRLMMGKKRYIHSCNVADMCVKLAQLFGEDVNKAYTAGILHDCRKEADADVQRREMTASGYYVDPAELDSKSTWHGIAAAYYVRHELGIDDKDILNAIRYHTVGHAAMSKLEKIVYLGDLVSAERDFPDVEKYRAYAMRDLDDAMYRALKWSIGNLSESGKKIPVCTIEAYNYYIDKKLKKD
ncbi:MAG: bis(5'-nucleosyl)-tetraphosphatase (symmetrical) YqeK [Ruminiclostridium sp.]|nr:bis(5'-nucleosyl)-tetraphosphatase (symmetrical) YqeK [Ruminiclostridium sp.]